MNDRPAAIKATFSDFRIVKTRKLAQLIFETPIENADEALAILGGLPRSDKEAWCGIARLGVEQPPVKAVAQHRPFHELPFSTQCALKSDDPAFALYMDADPGSDCAESIRYACGVTSRADIKAGTPAGDKWIEILRGYERAR